MFNDTDIDNPMAKIVELGISFFVNKCSALSAEKSVTSSQQIVNLKLFGAFTFPKPELLEKKNKLEVNILPKPEFLLKYLSLFLCLKKRNFLHYSEKS